MPLSACPTVAHGGEWNTRDYGFARGAIAISSESTLTQPATDKSNAVEETRCGCYYRPNVDILEKGDELLVLADIPGASGDDIDVDCEDGTLTIDAKVDVRDDKDAEYLVREYGVGNYHRPFQVSEAIDGQKISAEYADGVLSLHLPKAEAAKPRKISIETT